MNGIRIETRVLAPPGGFSSLSFGGGQPTGDIYRGHDFNPKANKRRISKESPAETKPPINNKNSASRRVGGHAVKPPPDNNLRTNLRRAADVREQSEKENKMRGYANRERRDSLDELIENPRKPTSSSSGGGGRAIPGLEGYNGSNSSNHGSNCANNYRAISPIDTSAHGRNRSQQQQINKSDYAEILRQQIAAKKNLTDEDGFERHHSRGQQGGGGGGRGSSSSSSSAAHRAYPQYEYHSQENQQQQQSNRRRGQASHDNADRHQGEGAISTSSRRSQYGSGGGHSSISLSWE